METKIILILLMVVSVLKTSNSQEKEQADIGHHRVSSSSVEQMDESQRNRRHRYDYDNDVTGSHRPNGIDGGGYGTVAGMSPPQCRVSCRRECPPGLGGLFASCRQSCFRQCCTFQPMSGSFN